MLAQASLDIPLNDTVKWLIGMIGVMTLGITVMTFISQFRKMFGRTPPLDKEFAKLRSELYEVNGRTKKAMEKEIATNAKRMDGIEEEIEEIKLDRERKWQALTNEYHALDNKISTLTERISNVLKRLDENL